MPLFLGGGNLVADAFAGDFPLELGEGVSLASASLCLVFSNIRFGVAETGSISHRDWLRASTGVKPRRTVGLWLPRRRESHPLATRTAGDETMSAQSKRGEIGTVRARTGESAR
jgi:hypothetical protein